MSEKETTKAIETKEVSLLQTASNCISVMKELSAVMDQETSSLTQKDVAGMDVLRKEKIRLTRDYQSMMISLINEPEQLKALPEVVRAQLKHFGAGLAKTAEQNAERLKTAITATQSLIGTIITVAREQNRPFDSYSDPRKGGKAELFSPSQSTPVAINRTA